MAIDTSAARSDEQTQATDPPPVALVGYRGTGKSTVGRLLAQHLGRPFIDLDDEIERIEGRSIASIFASDGEAAFRVLESTALARAVTRSQVIATGGGVIGRHDNRELLQPLPVIWLQAKVDTICRRLASDATTQARRPSLTESATMRDEVTTLLEQRGPLYEACATWCVDTDDLAGPNAIARECARLLSLPGSGQQ